MWYSKPKFTRQLKRTYSKIAPWANLICLFKPVRKLNSLSKLKSPYRFLSQSGVVYKNRCLDCQEFYVGLTQRILQIRLSDKNSIYDHQNKTKHNNDLHKKTISLQFIEPKHRFFSLKPLVISNHVYNT